MAGIAVRRQGSRHLIVGIVMAAVMSACATSTASPAASPGAPAGTSAASLAPTKAPSVGSASPSSGAIRVAGLDFDLRPITPPIASIDIGEQSSGWGNASDGTWLWVMTDTGAVAIDPTTNSVKRRIPLPISADGYTLDASNGTVWISDYDEQAVYRYDARTGQRLASIALPYADCVAVAAGAVWACDHHEGAVVRIDTKTNTVVKTIIVGSRGSDGPGQIAAAGGSLWVVVGNDAAIVRIDPKTNSIVKTIHTYADEPLSITVSPDQIWAVVDDGSGLALVDPADQKPPRTTQFNGVSTAVVVDGIPWAGFLASSSDTAGALIAIDPASGRVIDGLSIPDGSVTRPFQAFGSVWLVLGLQGLIERYPPSALTVKH